MRQVTPPRPAVTVATVVARDGRFLLVEEHTRTGLRLNQPAGHVEGAETLVDAAIRETLEETGYHVAPTALVGIYRWQSPETRATFVRFAFVAEIVGHDAGRRLDDGIVQVHWLDCEQLAAKRALHRSPLVQRCVDDFLAGRRLPLDAVTEY